VTATTTVHRWRSRAALVALLASMVALGSCTAEGPSLRLGSLASPGTRNELIVGSFNFAESEVLAQVYGQAIRATGAPVRIMSGIGPRELVDPALAAGLLEFVPEYSGSAVQFLTVGREVGTSDAGATHRALARVAQARGLVALRPAPAEDQNVLVVTRRTARRFGLRSISDLQPVARRLLFGGPPECAHRQDCLPGLKRLYGLTFRGFAPLDVGGPLTLQALITRSIDVALLFSTDPAIEQRQLVVLTDDRSLQPAESVTPIVRRDALTRWPTVAETVDAVSSRLTTDVLRGLVETTMSGGSPAEVAVAWLRSQGLI